MAEQKQKLPAVGDLVQYYRNGLPSTRPVAAVVTDVNDSQKTWLYLSLINRDYGGLQPIGSHVRHIDDPHFVENPGELAKTGAWKEIVR